MSVTIDGTTGITAPALDLITPLPVSEGGSGSSVIQPYQMALGTPIETTSGTFHDFTGIPSWVKRITVIFNGVSTNGLTDWGVQLGDSEGIETTGYSGGIGHAGSNTYPTTIAQVVHSATAAAIANGNVFISKSNNSNRWVINGISGVTGYTYAAHGFGYSKTLSGTLDRIRLTTVNGTDIFDAGSVNIMYEGYVG